MPTTSGVIPGKIRAECHLLRHGTPTLRQALSPVRGGSAGTFVDWVSP